ncbi:MAG: winged helix-turn-helix transcriptional regulator [Tenericutes bacterium]|nr:winged helix-turn-helix transcriptional regulator [Mycoplasmatota bacterium]
MPLNNPFLKATPLYKEYAILELLSKDSNITQRAIAKQLDSSLSMINQYLEEYEIKKLLKREYITSKQVAYKITKIGITRLRELNIIYLETIRSIYLDAKKDVMHLLKQIIKPEMKNIIMYGAGEVAELTLMAILEEQELPFNIVAIIDDDADKQNNSILTVPIISRESLSDFEYDAILISSYSHKEEINKKLVNTKILEKNIIEYF